MTTVTGRNLTVATFPMLYGKIRLYWSDRFRPGRTKYEWNETLSLTRRFRSSGTFLSEMQESPIGGKTRPNPPPDPVAGFRVGQREGGVKARKKGLVNACVPLVRNSGYATATINVLQLTLINDM